MPLSDILTRVKFNVHVVFMCDLILWRQLGESLLKNMRQDPVKSKDVYFWKCFLSRFHPKNELTWKSCYQLLFLFQLVSYFDLFLWILEALLFLFSPLLDSKKIYGLYKIYYLYPKEAWFFLKEKMRISFSGAVILAPFKNIIISCSFN